MRLSLLRYDAGWKKVSSTTRHNEREGKDMDLYFRCGARTLGTQEVKVIKSYYASYLLFVCLKRGAEILTDADKFSLALRHDEVKGTSASR